MIVDYDKLYNSLNTNQKAILLDYDNTNAEMSQGDKVNPEYIKWITEGRKGYEPPYWWSDKLKETPEQVAQKQQKYEVAKAQLDASQAILQASYEASHNDPNTTHGKSGATANNNGSKSCIELMKIHSQMRR